MTKFFEDRTTVRATDLRGPRVYSTDLLPDLFDPSDVAGSVQTAARALKVKMLSRGLVTLNGAYLVSPMGVHLLRAYPSLLAGEAILPAVLSDKEGLRNLVSAPPAAYTAAGISDSELAAHIAAVEEQMHKVMPWDITDASEKYRSDLIKGLSSDSSLIHRQLVATGVYDDARRKALIDTIAAVDMSRSANVRELIANEVPGALQPLLQRFATACYHGIGTAVVQCETGADLSPLSQYKAADMILTDRDATQAQLSEETMFARYFMAKALGTIQAHNAIPSAVIDDIGFEHVHALSGALRESGFQEGYEIILENFARLTTTGDPGDALENLDAASVTQAATDLAKIFEDAVLKELPDYSTREYELEKAEMITSGSDVLMEGLNILPIGNIVAFAKTTRSAVRAMGGAAATLKARDYDKALTSADERRREDIEQIIKGLGTSDPKKASLLDGIAAMADIQGVANRRA